VATAALPTASWTLSPSLQILVATTTHYEANWLLGTTIWKTYNYETCDGWVSDDFITPAQNNCFVGWNLVTNDMWAAQNGSNTFNMSAAEDCASYAIQTIFPGGNLSTLVLH
jgi:hypothetical protein